MDTKKSLGICLGASNIKVVELLREGDELAVGLQLVRNHESNPRAIFEHMLEEVNLGAYDYVCITGRKFRDLVNLPSITEPEAIEHALRMPGVVDQAEPPPTVVASLGAETFIVYVLDNFGSIATVGTGNKCASGTGEFFLQQVRRMNISVEDALMVARDVKHYSVSGRCSVFCKSDCTHALNKGIPIGRVTAGLCLMMVEKVMDLLDKVEVRRVLAVGGVTHNHVVMEWLRGRVDSLRIPIYADVFEALGAAVYAMKSGTKAPTKTVHNIFRSGRTSFTFLPPLSQGERLVRFEKPHGTVAAAGDECIVGLDVGSTTTKAVALRISDNAVVGSVYLRTNGNPVAASRECYRQLLKQTQGRIRVTGLATTGSGRHIAGLHAGTDAIINEIIAHATGATYYDKDVDTIFEIGGQDAKYTYLTNGVASDYAMNEACSAGTGSFLEESAYESLGINYLEIEKIALLGRNPPNFNDQCAAFISSDIKTATHEGIRREDIVAGLVYSICMNYVNRVKGQRRVGRKIFMQGGVCYNRAVPLAMANLIGREIVVPPDPGLIGAFGVALELKNRIAAGLAQSQHFDLYQLSERQIEYGKNFRCAGGREKCDRGCEINMLIVGGRRFPFGGACNKYYNLVHHIQHDTAKHDLVRKRQAMVFGFSVCASASGQKRRPTVGISRSFLINTYAPLFYGFFSSLGCEVVLSNGVDPDGVKRRRSSFCYPGEIAHGCYANLLKKGLDYIFLPKIVELYVEKSVSYKKEHQCTCLLLQSEAYWLQSAFRGVCSRSVLLSPTLSFREGLDTQVEEFTQIAQTLGLSRADGIAAYREGLRRQQEFSEALKNMGWQVLEQLQKDASQIAVVLFGRPYNTFAAEANFGIPTKFASRGVTVIPWDCLPFEDEPCDKDMCWAMGQNLLKAASYVKKHHQLFATFVTNFSCGPDSFVVGYFRDIMRSKPSLTLELDSHTADAGVNTRIEAFLDIVARYRQLRIPEPVEEPFTPAQVVFENGKGIYLTSWGERVSLRDPRVHILFPSMGPLSSELISAAFTGCGMHSSCLPVYDFDVLKFGRANASCKECLPLQLTTGGLLNYLHRRQDQSELLAYLMPTTPGNCRFTQYSVFLRNLIRKNRLRNVALLSFTTENGYAGLPIPDVLNVLRSVIVADVMEDIRNALEALAVNRKEARRVFEHQWRRICDCFATRRGKGLYSLLRDVASELKAIALSRPLGEAVKVGLLGEIFVRRDYYSCQDLVERLQRRGIVVKRAHAMEWFIYIDHMVLNKVYDPGFDMKGWLEFRAKILLESLYEKKIKRILANSGLYEYATVDMKRLLEYGKSFFDLRFTGEPILVVGSFFKEMLHSVHGVISIGPFACMPTRVIEAVLSAESNMTVKRRLDAQYNGHCDYELPDGFPLPFLSLESDGNPFPQIVEARIEAFCLQVERLYRLIRDIKQKVPSMRRLATAAGVLNL